MATEPSGRHFYAISKMEARASPPDVEAEIAAIAIGPAAEASGSR